MLSKGSVSAMVENIIDVSVERLMDLKNLCLIYIRFCFHKQGFLQRCCYAHVLRIICYVGKKEYKTNVYIRKIRNREVRVPDFV